MKPQHPYTVPAQTRLSYRLRVAFEAEPLEDGMNHPAEEIIAKALQSREDRQVLDRLESLSLDAKCPGFAASVMRCIGRQVNPGTASWRAGLVRAGLAADNVEIRDAAVQAAESWGGGVLGRRSPGAAWRWRKFSKSTTRPNSGFTIIFWT